MPTLALYTDPVLGIDMTVVTATPYVKAGTTLTAGTPVQLAVPTEKINLKVKGTSAQIEGANSPGENNVEYARSAEGSISCYRENGDTNDPLADLTVTMAIGDILELSYTEAQGSGTRITTVYGSFGDLDTGFDQRGKQMSVLNIKSVALSKAWGANWTITSS